MDGVGVAAIEVIDGERGLVDVAGAEDEEASRGVVALVEVVEPLRARIERAASGERVDRRRPRGGLTAIALIGRSDGHREGASSLRGLDFCAARRFGGDGTVEVGRVHGVPVGRQDLHRLEPVPERDVLCAGENRREVTVEREASHLGAVTEVVVRTPRGVAAVAVGGVEGCLEQRVPARDPGIEHADRWRIGRWRRDARAQLLRPRALVLRAHFHEDRGGLLGLADLGHVVEHIDRRGEPGRRAAHEGDEAIVEHESTRRDLDILRSSELHQALELVAVLATEPDLPPDRLVLLGVGLGCVGPQAAKRGEPKGCDRIDHVLVAAFSLLLRRSLRVALEALEKVLHLAVGHEHRRALDAAWLGLVGLRVADGDDLDALPRVLERRHLERHVGLALELHVEPGHRAVDLDAGFVAALVGLDDSGLERAFERLAVLRAARRRRRLGDVDLPPVRLVLLGRRWAGDEDVLAVARSGHASVPLAPAMRAYCVVPQARPRARCPARPWCDRELRSLQPARRPSRSLRG